MAKTYNMMDLLLSFVYTFLYCVRNTSLKRTFQIQKKYYFDVCYGIANKNAKSVFVNMAVKLEQSTVIRFRWVLDGRFPLSAF